MKFWPHHFIPESSHDDISINPKFLVTQVVNPIRLFLHQASSPSVCSARLPGSRLQWLFLFWSIPSIRQSIWRTEGRARISHAVDVDWRCFYVLKMAYRLIQIFYVILTFHNVLKIFSSLGQMHDSQTTHNILLVSRLHIFGGWCIWYTSKHPPSNWSFKNKLKSHIFILISSYTGYRLRAEASVAVRFATPCSPSSFLGGSTVPDWCHSIVYSFVCWFFQVWTKRGPHAKADRSGEAGMPAPANSGTESNCIRRSEHADS